jgi:hypothetical protein
LKGVCKGKYASPLSFLCLFESAELSAWPNNGGIIVTIEEIEQIEDRARRELPIDPKTILRLTGYLRDVLQQKANAEAVTELAVRKAGLHSRYYTAASGARLADSESLDLP